MMSISRRTFLKLAGSAAVLAASPGIAFTDVSDQPKARRVVNPELEPPGGITYDIELAPGEYTLSWSEKGIEPGAEWTRYVKYFTVTETEAESKYQLSIITDKGEKYISQIMVENACIPWRPRRGGRVENLFPDSERVDIIGGNSGVKSIGYHKT